MVLSSSEVIPGNSELRETRVQREARISPRLNAYAKPRPMTSGWPRVSPSWPRLPGSLGDPRLKSHPHGPKHSEKDTPELIEN
jgi:hypothetical protein